MTIAYTDAVFENFGVRFPESDARALRVLMEIAAPRGNVRRPWRVIDVGSWTGHTALVLARAANYRSWRPGTCWCVENWQGSPDGSDQALERHGPEAALAALAANAGRRWLTELTPLIGDSGLWAAAWPERLDVDLVFLDAAHDYEGAVRDITGWGPRVRKGGILCGHDYGRADGLTRAVDDLCPKAQVFGDCVWWKQC